MTINPERDEILTLHFDVSSLMFQLKTDANVERGEFSFHTPVRVQVLTTPDIKRK